MNKFNISYDQSGRVNAVYLNRGHQQEPMWASLPYQADRGFSPTTKIEAEILEEAQSLSEWPLDLSDRPPDPLPPPTPNWDAFFVQAYHSPVYLRITEQNPLAKQRAVTRLENLLGNKPYYRAQYELLKRFWDEAGAGIIPAFSTSEVNALNAIALANAMPFKFDGTGKMVLL